MGGLGGRGLRAEQRAPPATSVPRPAGGPRRASRPGRGRPRCRGPLGADAARRPLRADEGAQRGQRVVGDEARPDEVPQRRPARWRRRRAGRLPARRRVRSVQNEAPRCSRWASSAAWSGLGLEAARRRGQQETAPGRGRRGGCARPWSRWRRRPPTPPRPRCTARRGRPAGGRPGGRRRTSRSSDGRHQRRALELGRAPRPGRPTPRRLRADAVPARAGSGPARPRRPARPPGAGRPASGGAAGAARRRRTTPAPRRRAGTRRARPGPRPRSASSAGRTGSTATP